MKSVPIVVAVPLLALLFLILALADSPPAVPPPLNPMRSHQALYQLTTQTSDGWTPAQYVQAGDLWQRAGDPARALPYWQSALRLAPDDPDILRRLATTTLDLQDWTQAVVALEPLQAYEAHVRWASYHLGLIRAAFDPVQASADLRVAARDPMYGPVTADLLAVLLDEPAASDLPQRVGEVLLRHDLWGYAELAFRHALDLHPADGVTAAYVALARLRQGKDSREWTAIAEMRAPDSGLVHYVAGLQQREQGERTASLGSFIQAAALAPDNPAFFAELGTAYRLVGDMENAERWLRMAVTTAYGDARFEELLALFYAEEGYNLDDTGLEALRTTSEAQPDAPDLQAGYGWALYRLGEVEAAIEQLLSALELDSSSPRALFYLAQIRLEQGDETEAIGLLEQVAATASAFREEAQRTLDVLRGE